MIKTVLQMSVSSIFSIDNKNTYRIPKYQRAYTWGIAEWDALFNDVIENDKGYFLGSYICVNCSSLDKTILEVIDGQQRFSTITILMAAIYSKMSEYVDEMDDDDKTEWNNLRKEIANRESHYDSNGKKINEYKQKLELQKQYFNDVDYSYTLYDSGVITEHIDKPHKYGNRRIAKAYRHFKGLIEEQIIEIKENIKNISDIGALVYILKKFESAVLVGIEVDTNKDAYMLFESLNHRGVPLSAIDLIKNTLISNAESDGNIEEAYKKWQYCLKCIGGDENPTAQERFFRQYYNAFREELNEPYKSSDKKYYLGYLATKTTMLDIYEKMIKSDYKSFLDDFVKKAELYSILINNSDKFKPYSDSLLDLERISGTPSYMLLLYILAYQEKLNLADNDLDEIIHLLTRFFVRRNLTDVPGTRKLTQLFIDIINSIKDKNGNEIISLIREELSNVSCTDELFEGKLRGPIYDDNPDVTRFILCSIESKNQTKEIYTDLWSKDNTNKKFKWTIEHIFPEGENIPECWVDMIADGNIDLAKTYRSDYVHTLGNLTITGYNQNLSNMAFDQKRDRKSKDKSKEIGYRNGLYLNKDVVDKDKWTIDDIKSRTDKIVKLLLDMYKL